MVHGVAPVAAPAVAVAEPVDASEARFLRIMLDDDAPASPEPVDKGAARVPMID